MRYGYERSLEQIKELNLESWRQARSVAYAAIAPHFKDKNTTPWSFMPLPGDPTPDELSAMKEAEAKRNEEEWNGVLDQYKQLGILTENVIAVA